jgi:hypothetical protein
MGVAVGVLEGVGVGVSVSVSVGVAVLVGVGVAVANSEPTDGLKLQARPSTASKSTSAIFFIFSPW